MKELRRASLNWYESADLLLLSSVSASSKRCWPRTKEVAELCSRSCDSLMEPTEDARPRGHARRWLLTEDARPRGHAQRRYSASSRTSSHSRSRRASEPSRRRCCGAFGPQKSAAVACSSCRGYLALLEGPTPSSCWFGASGARPPAASGEAPVKALVKALSPPMCWCCPVPERCCRPASSSSSRCGGSSAL